MKLIFSILSAAARRVLRPSATTSELTLCSAEPKPKKKIQEPHGCGLAGFIVRGVSRLKWMFLMKPVLRKQEVGIV